MAKNADKLIEKVVDAEIVESEVETDGNGHGGISDADIEAFHKKEEEAEIPGIKSIYRVEDQWVGEVTDLNEREIAAYSIGDMQQAVGDQKRTKSLYHILKIAAFRYKLSKGGKGHDDAIILHRLNADMKAQSATGGANFGQPS